MSQHTPGPWRLRNSGLALIIEGAEESCPIEGRARGAVCTTGWFPACAGNKKHRSTEPTERQAADAALITAAPDLLGACKLAIRNLDPSPYWIGALLAAVAKAEGR